MKNRYFVDTNIWLYAFMDEGRRRNEKALLIISEPDAVLSTQILNEICINLIKKADYKENAIVKLIENMYGKYKVVTIDKRIILTSSFVRANYQASFWDSFVIASALETECSILYSEDMQDGQIIRDTLSIKNPFK